jgi:DNA mismatch repair ATPase MutL
MTVEHLSARVPARLNFLKSTNTERSHIDSVVVRYAVAYPNIRFSLHYDSRLSFQLLGSGDLRDVLVETCAQILVIGGERICSGRGNYRSVRLRRPATT